MERIDIPSGSFKLARRGFRFRSRRAELDPEQAAIESPPEAQREPGLSAYVPSPLVPTDRRVAALIVGGAPAWSRRLRRIDTLTDRVLATLEQAWRALAQAHRGRPEEFADSWRAHAASCELGPINELIRRHNLHFPAERNLPMDVRTGDYVGPGGGDYRRPLLDRDWVLERFPPDLEAASG